MFAVVFFIHNFIRVSNDSKMLFSFAVLCFATLALGDEKIHEKMSAEEVEEIFQTRHDLVPEYEVVQFQVSRLIKRGSRSARSLRVKAFGGDMKLWLQPAEGILAGKNTPVLIAKKSPKGKDIVYENYSDGLKNVGKLMEDPAMKASMLLAKDSQGRYSVNGVIGSKHLVVRSLPDSISEELSKNRSSENRLSSYHVVFKREVKNVEGNHKIFRLNETRSRVSRSNPPAIPAVVYPEIMLVVDSTLYSLNGNNVDKVLAYAVTFWNGVDLMYRSFEEPKFRFNIARIIVAKEPEAVHYISESMVSSKIYNAYEALMGAEEYYYKLLNVFAENSYDAVVTLSRFEMSDGSDEPDILGIMSKRGGACLVDHKEKIMQNVAIITDDGSFGGVFTAAHEFAHLLGSNHDDWFTCKPKDGYIMTSHSGITEHSHDFSVCTVEDIQEYLNDNRGTCLYNVPKTVDPLPRVLPGRMRDRDYQCKMMSRGKSCYDEAKKTHLACRAIYCTDPTDAKQCLENKEFAPADGAFCAKGKVCLHGQCIKV